MYIFIALAFSGLIFKVLEKVIQFRGTPEGEGVSIVKYFTDNPYRTILSIFGTIVGFLFLLENNQLNGAAAFGVGYLGESAARFITDKFNPEK